VCGQLKPRHCHRAQCRRDHGVRGRKIRLGRAPRTVRTVRDPEDEFVGSRHDLRTVVIVMRVTRVVVQRRRLVSGGQVGAQVRMLDDTTAEAVVMIVTHPGPFRMHMAMRRERKTHEDRKHGGARGKGL